MPEPRKPARRLLDLTLIASLNCMDGLLLAADTEEVILQPPLLKTRREKLRVLRTPVLCQWQVVIGGAGEYDYIGMMEDFIEDKLSTGTFNPTSAEIEQAIRESVAEVWRDYARYEQRAIDVKMLIASRESKQSLPRLSVVSGAAIRRGAPIEAIGTGDAIFKALADRFMPYSGLSTVSALSAAARIFMVYAMFQAKQSIPGIGGNTRVLTLTDKGEIRPMKSWAVGEIQRFFSSIDLQIRGSIPALDSVKGDPVEWLIGSLAQTTLESYRTLKKQLKEIEDDDSLV